jgi:hypothetical protein
LTARGQENYYQQCKVEPTFIHIGSDQGQNEYCNSKPPEYFCKSGDRNKSPQRSTCWPGMDRRHHRCCSLDVSLLDCRPRFLWRSSRARFVNRAIRSSSRRLRITWRSSSHRTEVQNLSAGDISLWFCVGWLYIWSAVL